MALIPPVLCPHNISSSIKLLFERGSNGLILPVTYTGVISFKEWTPKLHPVKDLSLGLLWLLVVFLTKQYVTIPSWDQAESAFWNDWIHWFGFVIHLPSWHLLQSYYSSEGFHNPKLVFVWSCKKQYSWEEGGRNTSIPINKKSASW